MDFQCNPIETLSRCQRRLVHPLLRHCLPQDSIQVGRIPPDWKPYVFEFHLPPLIVRGVGNHHQMSLAGGGYHHHMSLAGGGFPRGWGVSVPEDGE